MGLKIFFTVDGKKYCEKFESQDAAYHFIEGLKNMNNYTLNNVEPVNGEDWEDIKEKLTNLVNKSLNSNFPDDAGRLS